MRVFVVALESLVLIAQHLLANTLSDRAVSPTREQFLHEWSLLRESVSSSNNIRRVTLNSRPRRL